MIGILTHRTSREGELGSNQGKSQVSERIKSELRETNLQRTHNKHPKGHFVQELVEARRTKEILADFGGHAVAKHAVTRSANDAVDDSSDELE